MLISLCYVGPINERISLLHLSFQRFQNIYKQQVFQMIWGGGSGTVVKAACLVSRRSRVQSPLRPSSFKVTKCFPPLTREDSILWGASVTACSASDRQGSNFKSCVWRVVSSDSSHHPQEVLLAQFSLHVHRGDIIPFISFISADMITIDS